MTPEVVRELPALQSRIAGWRREGLRIGFVPTMGALHEGHLDLVRAAFHEAERVVVSIFVNPTQFAPTEDLARYPRDEAGDLARLATVGADLVWMPGVDTMYPPGGRSWVEVEGVSEGLESLTRPHFFRGVATVVTKLLNQVQADLAMFGEKDYQQLVLVRRLVLDLAIPTRIVAHPTVREADGLAMSSRNRYLTPDQRALAPRFQALLAEAAARLAGGAEAQPILEAIRSALRDAGFDAVDYVELRDAATLAPLDRLADRPGSLLAVVRLGGTRLLDNLPVIPAAATDRAAAG